MGVKASKTPNAWDMYTSDLYGTNGKVLSSPWYNSDPKTPWVTSRSANPFFVRCVKDLNVTETEYEKNYGNSTTDAFEDNN